MKTITNSHYKGNSLDFFRPKSYQYYAFLLVGYHHDLFKLTEFSLDQYYVYCWDQIDIFIEEQYYAYV